MREGSNAHFSNRYILCTRMYDCFQSLTSPPPIWGIEGQTHEKPLHLTLTSPAFLTTDSATTSLLHVQQNLILMQQKSEQSGTFPHLLVLHSELRAGS